MSVGGPCLWLPSLSSPVPSPLSAVSSHLSSARNSDRFSLGSRTISPRLPVQRKEEPGVPVSTPRSAEMQSTEYKAKEDLSHGGTQPSLAGSGPFSSETSSRDPVNRRLEAAKQDMLPRVKLQIPSLDQRVFSTTQPLVGHGGHSEETGVSSFAGSHDPRDDHGPESTVSPDDDKDMMGSDDNNRSPSMEKKKMRRFRLTHNQTRFLMSEFTRQAHPDAAHRERLSKEIPGLTPRQVQVWFQNRRAKLKRLTTNDRERMLKSRALPDDFDTTKVLRTPFEGKSTGVTPVASPQGYTTPNPDFGALRTLRTERFPRSNEDEYLVSPLSSATSGPYMSSGQGQMFRPAASASASDLHRSLRSDYSITRSSSLSDTSAHPSPYAGYGMPNRFAPNQPGMPYMGRPMEYAVPRHPGGMGYDQHQSFEGSVSPTDSHMAYEMNTLGSQQPNYNLGLASQLPQARPLAMQNLPISAAPDYRQYAYDTTAAPMGTIPYTQANPSNLSLPTSFGTDSAKFGNPPYNYANYIQQ